MKITYIANDGTFFDDELQCKQYEASLEVSKRHFNFPHIHFFNHGKQELHFTKFQEFKNAYASEKIGFVYLDHVQMKEIHQFITYLENASYGCPYSNFLVSFKNSVKHFNECDCITDLGSINCYGVCSLYSQTMGYIQEMLEREKTK